jgi:hypothetical protein
MRRRFVAAHDPDFMSRSHILGNGAADNTDLLIDVAFTVHACATAHNTDLVSGELVAGIADHCSDAAATFIYNPAEAWNPYMWLAVDDGSVARLWVGGSW